MLNVNKIKAVLVLKGKTQQELADHLGICRMALNNKLNNRSAISVHQLKLIADYLDINISELFD